MCTMARHKVAVAVLVFIAVTEVACDVREACISSDKSYARDWPIAREIEDKTNYLKNAAWATIRSVFHISDVCGCINKDEKLGNFNVSDLVTYTSKLKYKGQTLEVTTRVSVQTVVKDIEDGYGLAQGTVICYKYNVTSSYRCNLLAKPAHLLHLESVDPDRAAYIGYSTNEISFPIPGMLMLMSRRDLANDVGLSWHSDTYDKSEYDLALPRGYADNGPSSIVVQTVNADYVGPNCKRRAILQQSIASELTGGAIFQCVRLGNMQVYTIDGFAYALRHPADKPCSEKLIYPYAVLTLGAYNKVGVPQGFMTIYNKTGNNNHGAPNNTIINTLSCRVTSQNVPPDQQVLDVAYAYYGWFSMLPSRPPNYTTVVKIEGSERSSVDCSAAEHNNLDSNANVLVAGEATSALTLEILGGLKTRPYGIVQPNGQATPCKIIPDKGQDGFKVDDSNFGLAVNNSIVYAFEYTFNSQNKLQYEAMANRFSTMQDSYSYGSTLTTCVTTVVAGMGVPLFHRFRYIPVIEKMVFALVLAILIIGSNLAAIFVIRDMHNANQHVETYQISDTSEDVYTLSYYDHNMLVDVTVKMSGAVHNYSFKLALLILSMLLAITFILCRWWNILFNNASNNTGSSKTNIQLANNSLQP